MAMENPAEDPVEGQAEGHAHAPASDRLLDAALDVIADQGWRGATLGEIALRAGVSLADLYALFPSRTHLLAMCATPSQLDHFAALVFQQYGEQPTLREGRC